MLNIIDELKRIGKLATLAETMNKLKICETSQEMEDYFEDRTNQHIDLVRHAIAKIVNVNPEWKEFNETELLSRGKKHDASKFKEPERTPYISLTWRHKLENEKGEFDPINGKGYRTPGLLTKEEENKATLHHVTTNSHHPEFHSKEQANISKDDRDESDKVIDATRMPPIDIAEMMADWQAMSQEFKTNTAREWYDKQKDVRWHFSPEQDQLIDKLLKVFEDDKIAELVGKRIQLNRDVEYVSFTMPKGSTGEAIEHDGGMLEVRFDSNGKTLEVPPMCAELHIAEGDVGNKITIQNYIHTNQVDVGGVNLGRIKASAWEEIKDLNLPNRLSKLT